MLIEVLILLTILAYFLFKKLKKRHIVFIGPRNSGKTVVINTIIGRDYETLPTLKNYTVAYKDILISEKILEIFYKDSTPKFDFSSYKPSFGEETVFMARESDLNEVRRTYKGTVYTLGKNKGSEGVVYIENLNDVKKILKID